MKQLGYGAVAAVLTVAVLAQPAPATFPGRNGRVLFQSVEDLATCKFIAPHAHAADQDCYGDDPVPLFTVTPEGKGLRRLPVDADLTAAIAPGGRFVAVGGEIRTIGGRAVGPVGLKLDEFRWAPDGHHIVFTDGTQALATAGLHERHAHVFFRLPAGGSRLGRAPVWSPNGRWIAFERYEANRSGDPDIWIVHPDGRGARLLARSAGAPDWSPDSRSIAFQGGSFEYESIGRYGISRVDVDGRHLRRLTRVEDEQPTFSPDGRWIAFARRTRTHERHDLMVIPSAGGRPRMVVAGGWRPAWQPLPR